MDKLGTEYLQYCEERKLQRREHFNRAKGAVPLCGHHIDPRGGGEKDDWDHPNIVPLSPAENFTAHVMRFLADPSEEEWREIRRMTASGELNTPEKFEAAVIRAYDLGSVKRC
jgi:hypothetical protein